MNIKDLAALFEEEMQSHVHIGIKTVKSDYALLEVEDDEGKSFLLKLTKVKEAEAEDDDDSVEVDLDEDDEEL